MKKVEFTSLTVILPGDKLKELKYFQEKLSQFLIKHCNGHEIKYGFDWRK